jgi:hypothetical protein
MKNKDQAPLPKELLPKSAVDGEPDLWENRVQSLKTAASPILAQYRTLPVPWWSILAARLQPRLAVAVAAAAAITVAVHLSLPGPKAQSAPSLSLAAVIGEGNTTTTLLSIANENIDPVLALVILEGDTP